MDKEDVIKNLRSCLISCKGGIKLDNLSKDYFTVSGDPLPFKRLGYSSVESFVRSIPDVTVIKRNGELYVEAIPSKTSAHLTKLVSRQKARRKIRSQPKKWNPPRHAKSFPSGIKNNNVNLPGGLQASRNNYLKSLNSFTKSTPGKSNLYTDFSRPIPLVGTIVQHPLPQNNFKQSFSPNTPPSSPTRRLKNKMTNLNVTTVNQSVNNCKTKENLRCKILNDNTAASSVINEKPKTVEPRSSKLNERLKIAPATISPSIVNYRNNPLSTPSHIPSIFSIKVEPPFEIPDPRKELEIRANTLNLPSPIYKMYSKKEKNSTKTTIYASVKVGTHTFHTFPDDAASEEEAEKIAARLALVNLAKETSNPEVTTADKELIKEHILYIITRHPSGVFMHLLPEYYNELYGEALPCNWQTIIEECTDINQEKGVGNSTILCPVNAESNSKRSEESNSTLLKNVSENISNEKVQLNPIGPAAPDTLSVPEATIWQACTTYVMSTVEIWIRLGNENNDFVDMTNEMTRHYNQINKPVPAETCILNNFYTVFEENYWHRVQCTDFNKETGLATVFFVDEGYEEQYKSDVLYPLDKKFCILPCQAVRVALEGLKEFHDCIQMVTEIENCLLVDRLFYVEVHNMYEDDYGSYPTVTFYDTSEEEDININQLLFDKILQDMNNAFKIHAGQLIELYVTHVDDCGKVYAQLNSFAKTILSDNMFPSLPLSVVKTINFTKTYFVQWNSQWYRARVTDIPNKQEITVVLIDVGRTVLIPSNSLFHVTSKALHDIPPQAIQIFLQNIDQAMYNKKLIERFRELVSSTDLLLAKVNRISVAGIPVVEIFKRVEPSNMLASINTSLIYDAELSKASEDNNNNNKSKKRLDRKGSRAPETVLKLNPPMISDIGQYFDVHVTLVAHPGHFIVQPLNDANKLKEMMIELQNDYKEEDDLPLESVSERKLYAGKFRNDWYRVYVTDIISDNDVSVYFCDYGDVTIVPRNCLQPLKSKFLKLPYQAVKAKLVGIEPVNVDWSVTDCMKFKDLVLEKDFVSIIMESVFDNLSPVGGTMLGLRLIDVSTEKDIYIDKLLVEEKRAKFIKGFESLPS